MGATSTLAPGACEVAEEVVFVKKARTIVIRSIVVALAGGCLCQIALVLGAFRAWDREVRPIVKLRARVVATGGDDSGRLAGREGVRAIYFEANVGDAELAPLSGRLEGFPNLRTLRLEGPGVTDAALPTLIRLKQLDTLILEGTRVTGAGEARLRHSLPGLKVVSQAPVTR